MPSHRIDDGVSPCHDNSSIPQGPGSDQALGNYAFGFFNETANVINLWQAVYGRGGHDVTQRGRGMARLHTQNGKPAFFRRRNRMDDGSRKRFTFFNYMVGR